MTTLYIAELVELAGPDSTDGGVNLATLPPDNSATLSTAVAPVGAPNQTAPGTATTGGTIAAATYFLKITALTAAGESVPSNEQSITTTGTTSTITANWGAVTGATGYKVYIGTAAGQENLVATVGAVTTDVLTALPGTAGSPPAVTNTAAFITLKPTTRYVMLSTDSICSVKVGPNADCAQTDTRLAAGERVIFRVAQPQVLPAQSSGAVGFSNAVPPVLQASAAVGLKLSTVLNT